MRADLLASDDEGQPVLVAEVKGRPLDEDDLRQVLEYLGAQAPEVPYVMVVDPEKIRVVRHDGAGEAGPHCTLDTREILRHYDPASGVGEIRHNLLESLVGSWLRDFASHWKSEEPPGTGPFRAIGLADRLEGGATRGEVALGRDSLY